MSKMGNAYKKRKVLIVDDSEINRALLSDIISGEYQVLEAEDGMEAAVILQEREQEIALILLDIVMPVMDGLEFLALMNKKGWIKSIPVIMISAETSPKYVDRAYDLGALDYISKPFDERTVMHRVRSNILVSMKQHELSNMLVKQIYEKEKDNRLMIEILSNIVEFRNGESGLHVLHIFTLTELILKKVMEKTDRYHIDKADIPLICNASALHDIGKISVPEAILNKPGKLTKEEFEIMKQHSAEGARLLSRIPQRENEALIQMGYQICRWHHERYDGSGYPDGLKGEEIPIAAQVVALADVYDALTSKRVYKDAYSHEKAVEMILNGECGVFNPLLLECLEELSDTLKKELNVVSTSTYYEREILNAVESMVERDNVEVLERTLRILERERIKNQFYASVSHEVEFEYTMTPELFVLSEWGASYLNIPQVIQKPGESVFTEQVFPKAEFTEFLDKMRHTTAEHPQMEENVLLMIHGQNVPCKVIARSMWTSEDAPKYEGFIGKIVEQSI